MNVDHVPTGWLWSQHQCFQSGLLVLQNAALGTMWNRWWWGPGLVNYPHGD